jgi:hypothetical protein
MALPAVPNKRVQMRQYPIGDDEEWGEGAALGLDSGAAEALAANATPILGFAAHGVPLQPNDIYDGHAMAFVAGPTSTFWLEGSADPVQADEGEAYGWALSDGAAIVDKTETTDVRLRVERVDLARNLFEVSVIDEHRLLQD